MFNYPKIEEEILKFWQEKKIFEKSLDQTQNPKKGKRKDFVFYDGPPFATGLPHYGHILSSVAKDVFPRYKTMQGFYVRRRWGWDCHGLPIENIIEKDLGISGKKEIEAKIGIEKFNELCRSKVLTYIDDWKKMVDRVGRWVDFDNSYKTMDSTYMESVWWALKTLWDKGLIYEGKKVLMYCPHCETPVSKAEISMDNSYVTEKDLSVTIKFKITDEKFLKKYPKEQPCYFLAWTTTPWSLMSTMALAIDADADYVRFKYNNEYFILAKSRIQEIMKGLGDYEILEELKGKDIEGVKYEHVFNYHSNNNEVKKRDHLFQTFAVDYVLQTEGTGIVTINPAYGEIDYESGKKFDLPVIVDLTPIGTFMDVVTDFAGKKALLSNELVAESLKNRNLLLRSDWYEHSYPHCWRCNAKLIYRAISSWFINIQKHKDKIIKLNEKINWYPEHLKHGRFLNIIQDAPDWNISRNRYWATPLPFFKCECGNTECVGSVAELKEKAINFSEIFKSEKIQDLDIHKDKVDKIKVQCSKCGKQVSRIPEVIDCWVESASMPFAELHYPFENKEQFKDRLPAQYIAEYIAQTRTWFYYMHVMAVLLFESISFENVVSTGTILSEKGEKLSKSKRNFKDPWEIINQYGIDALRFHLMSNSVMSAEDMFFNERDVKDIYNKVINSLCNCAEFYSLYSKDNLSKADIENLQNILDKWIISKLNNLILDFTETMDKYDTIKSCRLIKDFIEDLSLWYVRRSRDRFKQEGQDKNEAQEVLKIVLETIAKIIAPILPYTAEFVYEKTYFVSSDQVELKDRESVHLCGWPKPNQKLVDKDLEEKMQEVRKLVSLALSERVAKSLKVRQPLSSLKIKNLKSKIINNKELLDLIKDEVNVKEIIFTEDILSEVELDTNLTEELKEEGTVREIIRAVQGERKNQKLVPDDKISVIMNLPEADIKVADKNKALLLKECRAVDIVFKLGNEIKIEIKKI